MLPQAWRPALREPVSSSARITGRLNKQAALPSAWLPSFLPRRQGRKAPWSPGERPAPGKTRAAGAPEAPACRNPGQPGDQDALAPRRQGGISWACPNYLLKFYEHAHIIARRPGCRMAWRPGRPGDPGGREAGRPGGQGGGWPEARETRVGDGREARETGRPGGIQTKTLIISNTCFK